MPFETFGEHLVRHGCTPMPFGAPAGAAAPAAGGFGGFADFSPGQVESDSSEESRTDESRVSASPPRCALSPEGPVSGHARVLAMDCGGSADMTAIDSAPADAGKSLLFTRAFIGDIDVLLRTAAAASYYTLHTKQYIIRTLYISEAHFAYKSLNDMDTSCTTVLVETLRDKARRRSVYGSITDLCRAPQSTCEACIPSSASCTAAPRTSCPCAARAKRGWPLPDRSVTVRHVARCCDSP